MSTTSATLLQRLKDSSDRAAWDRLVTLYAPMVKAWAYHAGASASEMDDFLQEVFLLLLKKLRSFEYDINGSFRGWLQTVVENKWYEFQRRKPKAVNGSSEFWGVAAAPPTSKVFEEEEYRRYLIRRVFELIQTDFQLSTREAFLQTALQGRPASEVARELGLTPADVYSARSRVMARLRSELSGLLDP